MTLSGELLIGLIAGLIIASIAFLIIRKRPLRSVLPTSKASPVADPRIEQLATRLGMIEKQLQLTRQDLEHTIAQALDSMRADVKLVQMQSQTSRSGAETDLVDLAVRLAREGLDTDDIARRTGLPKDLIESIRVLHKID